MSSSRVFNRVYRLEIQSVMLVFSTGFVNNCPSNLLQVSSPPLSTVKVWCLYKYLVHVIIYEKLSARLNVLRPIYANAVRHACYSLSSAIIKK